MVIFRLMKNRESAINRTQHSVVVRSPLVKHDIFKSSILKINIVVSQNYHGYEKWWGTFSLRMYTREYWTNICGYYCYPYLVASCLSYFYGRYSRCPGFHWPAGFHGPPTLLCCVVTRSYECLSNTLLMFVVVEVGYFSLYASPDSTASKILSKHSIEWNLLWLNWISFPNFDRKHCLGWPFST